MQINWTVFFLSAVGLSRTQMCREKEETRTHKVNVRAKINAQTNWINEVEKKATHRIIVDRL